MEEFWKSKVIASRYEFVEELGKGGIGTVILAMDKTLDKYVAIKILNANLSDEESIRFQQEGILSGRLRHENIVSVLDFGVTETNIPYLIMERLEGSSLARMLLDDGALEPLFAVQIFQQISRGMHSSHNHGVIHRDLKPANVIMVPNDDHSVSARIVDFGLARLTDRDARLTAAGSAIGSPFYMSPEQGQGLAGDERSDIYSMGCLMFEVLTGSTPFIGDTAVYTLMMHQSVQPERLSKRLQHEFPQLLEEIVATCLNKLPEDRYQSFGELLDDLEKMEAEIIRLDREQFLESRSRSGIQKALGSVTDFSAMTATLSRKNLATGTLTIGAVLVIVGFAICLLVPQVQSLLVVQKPEPPMEFDDTLTTFKKIDIKEEKDGTITCEAYQATTDEDLKQLVKYPRLEHLDLGDSNCDGTGLRALKNSKINYLSMHSTPASDDGLQAIADLKGLTVLRMNDCDDLEDSSLAHLSQCKALREFAWGGKFLTERSFKYLKTFPALLVLALDEFEISRVGIEEILKIPNLRSLTFQECKLDNAVFDRLEKSKRAFSNIGFHGTTFTGKMMSQMANVHTNNILLDDVKMTEAVYYRVSEDPRYRWINSTVNGKKVADRAPGK